MTRDPKDARDNLIGRVVDAQAERERELAAAVERRADGRRRLDADRARVLATVAEAEDIEAQRDMALSASVSDVRRIVGADRPTGFRTAGDRSPLGGMLEAARSGLLGKNRDAQEYMRTKAAEDEHVRFALIEALWRDIDREVRPIDLMTWRASNAVREELVERTVPEGELCDPADVAARQGGLCLEGLPSGGLCRRKVATDALGRSESTCEQHRDRMPQMADGRRTKDGEWYVRPATEIDPSHNPVGRKVGGRLVPDEVSLAGWYERAPEVAIPGFVVVAKLKLQAPSYEEIARTLLDDRTVTEARELLGLEAVAVMAEWGGVRFDLCTALTCGWLRGAASLSGPAAFEAWAESGEARRYVATAKESVPAFGVADVHRAVRRFARVVRRSEFFRLLYCE